MGDYRQREYRPYTAKGCFFIMIAIVFGIFGLGTAWYVVVDVSCVTQANRWLPDYPGAEFISEDYTFVRAWGIGETTRVLYTEDDSGTVRAWYSDRYRELDDEGYTRTDATARMRYVVRTADEGGSVITLLSNCSSGLVLTD